ncbi:cytochrome P450 4c21 [Bemisia tabaci]
MMFLTSEDDRRISISNYVLWFLIVVLLYLIFCHKKSTRVNEFLSTLPGPLELPFVGCVPTFLLQHSRYSDWMRIFDQYATCRMYRFSIFSDTFVVLSDPEVIQMVLRNPNCYDKDKSIYDLFRLPEILSTANGRKWLNERKAILPSFHPKLLSSFDATCQRHTQHLMTTLRKHAERGEPFDLGQEMTLLFIDIMSDSFLGVSANAQLNGLKEFANSLLTVPDCIMERVFIPPFRNDFIWRLCGRMQRFDAVKKSLYSVAKQLIVKRKRCSKNESLLKDEKNRMFLDILLKNSENKESKDESKLVFETGEIFTAGSITMGTTVSWVLLLSEVFPEVGDRLRGEIDTLMRTGNGVLTPEACNGLEYLDMVLKETLRHFGVPFIVRRSSEDVQIRGFKTIPKDTRILIMLASLHHHPDFWEKPYEFYPEHFSPKNVSSRMKNTFLPFSLGMRDCPGGKYAIQTMKYVLARTLLEMKFTAQHMKRWSNVYTENDLKFGFTQVPTKGFMATVKLRNEATKHG